MTATIWQRPKHLLRRRATAIFGRIPRCLLATLLLALSPLQTALAQPQQLLIISGKQQPLHHLFITQLKQRLATLNPNINRIRVVSSSEWQPVLSNNHSLTIVLGSQAAIAVSRHQLGSPVLYSLLPRAAYQQIVPAGNKCTPHGCGAIFIDQPLSRTLALTRLALPKLNTVGLLHSQRSSIELTEAVTAGKRQGIAIYHQPLDNPDDLIFSLTDILQHSDALLSLPDQGIYSRHTVQNILLTAYRYRKPVIGYSRAFVQAGALFAVYSTPAQLAQQTAEVVDQFFSQQSTTLPPPQFPRYFSVSVNHRVAKSLGLHMQSEATLQEKLEAIANE